MVMREYRRDKSKGNRGVCHDILVIMKICKIILEIGNLENVCCTNIYLVLK